MNNNKMADYWRKNSPRWEAGAYFEENSSIKRGFLESLSHYIRGRSVYVRMEKAKTLLTPHIQGKHVLDVGCASGRFAKMLIEAGAKHVTGVDISEAVIEIAQDNLENTPFQEQLTFLATDVRNSLSINADITTALGVIEYFSPDDLNNFFAHLSSTHFLLHFAEKPATVKAKLRHLLRTGYLKLKGCPHVFFYNVEYIKTVANQYGYANLWQTEHFVTNLPHE